MNVSKSDSTPQCDDNTRPSWQFYQCTMDALSKSLESAIIYLDKQQKEERYHRCIHRLLWGLQLSIWITVGTALVFWGTKSIAFVSLGLGLSLGIHLLFRKTKIPYRIMRWWVAL
jgi:hypothetical protein